MRGEGCLVLLALFRLCIVICRRCFVSKPHPSLCLLLVDWSLLLLQRAGQWRLELERFLSTKGSRYTLVDHRSLVGIVMFVYVREKHINDGAVKDVQVRLIARHGMAWHAWHTVGTSKLSRGHRCVAWHLPFNLRVGVWACVVVPSSLV